MICVVEKVRASLIAIPDESGARTGLCSLGGSLGAGMAGAGMFVGAVWGGMILVPGFALVGLRKLPGTVPDMRWMGKGIRPHQNVSRDFGRRILNLPVPEASMALSASPTRKAGERLRRRQLVRLARRASGSLVDDPQVIPPLAWHPEVRLNAVSTMRSWARSR